MLYVLLPILLIPVAWIGIGHWLSEPGYTGPISDHFDGKKFRNLGGRKEKGFNQAPKYLLSKEEKRSKWVYQSNEIIIKEPILDLEDQDKLRIYFVNHSTFLIQVKGVNILIDPIWSERASPFQFIGPKRMRPPGISKKALPRIDYIFLSHNHYDHLDLPFLKEINKRDQPQFVCSLGVDHFLRRHKFNIAGCLDWWDELKLGDLKITATPAQHFAARGLYDRNKTLWCGYHVSVGDMLSFYYVGDTGYGEIFKKIGNKMGPVDLAVIPIGAYKPKWFMGSIHCDPLEALQIHQDIKSNLSIACHYGTFPLAKDDQFEPIEELEKAKKESETENFMILPEGEFIDIKAK